MFDEFLTKATELWSAETPFVVAIVISYEPPVSGRPGDKAIIQPDGSVWGWIGGGCVQPLIVREAVKAIEETTPRIVRITPLAVPGTEPGIVTYTMSCHGGGGLVVYIEPVLPKSRVLVFGSSPVAQSLSKLCKETGYAVSVVAPEASREKFPEMDFIAREGNLTKLRSTRAKYVVVATQGEYDEEALQEALRTSASYISFVASQAKSRKIMNQLAEQGVPISELSRVKAPAGLNIGTSSPAEIAVSILAEIILTKKVGSRHGEGDPRTEESAPLRAAIDPVCGMTVDVDEPGDTSEYNGKLFYFCCSACKQSFDRQPKRYAGSILERVVSQDREPKNAPSHSR
jgi:xanthine dehydrogenase accessory factor